MVWEDIEFNCSQRMVSRNIYANATKTLSLMVVIPKFRGGFIGGKLWATEGRTLDSAVERVSLGEETVVKEDKFHDTSDCYLNFEKRYSLCVIES